MSVTLRSRTRFVPFASTGRCPMFTKRPMREELDFGRDPLLVQRDILKGEPLAEGNMLMQKMLVVGREAEVREVLSRGDDFNGDVPPHVKLILGKESLGLNEGTKHGTLRRLMSPAFRAEAVESRLPVLQSIVESHCQRWAGTGNISHWEESIKLMTFEVIVRIVLGPTALDPQQLVAASDDFAALMGGAVFPLTLTWGPFAFTPFGKAMSARAR